MEAAGSDDASSADDDDNAEWTPTTRPSLIDDRGLPGFKAQVNDCSVDDAAKQRANLALAILSKADEQGFSETPPPGPVGTDYEDQICDMAGLVRPDHKESGHNAVSIERDIARANATDAEQVMDVEPYPPEPRTVVAV